MRNDNDIRLVRISLTGTVEIDLERVEQDPVWATVARNVDVSDPEQLKQALESYVSRYLSQESLLDNAPFTNGPASLMGTNSEVL